MDSASLEAERIISRYKGAFIAPPKLVPCEKAADGPLLGNGDLGVVLSGPPECQRFHLDKNDFWSHNSAHMLRTITRVTLGGLQLDIPELAGARYSQEQEIYPAQVSGCFSRKGDYVLTTRAWTPRTTNLLAIELRNLGSQPLTIGVSQWVGDPQQGFPDADGPLHIGHLSHFVDNNSHDQFCGRIRDMRLFETCLSDEQARTVASLIDPDVRSHVEEDKIPGLVRKWDIRSMLDQQHGLVTEVLPANRTGRMSLAAWIWPDPDPSVRAARRAQQWGQTSQIEYGDMQVLAYKSAFTFCLLDGRPHLRVGRRFAMNDRAVPAGRWSHVAATYDGRDIALYINGERVPVLTFDRVERGQEEDLLWFTRYADGHHPQGGGRYASVATSVLGASPEMGEGTLRFSLPPGQKATLLTAVQSDLDAINPIAAAQTLVRQTDAEGLEALRTAHRRWWSDFWARSLVEIGDALIEQFYYGSLYLLACCAGGRDKVGPGLYGNWVTTDRPAWHADYTLNYNYQSPWWGAFSSNRVELTDTYDQPLLDLIEAGRACARSQGVARGVLYHVHIGPWGTILQHTLWGQKYPAIYAGLNMVMRFYYTQDQAYARRVYPYLREVIDFWEEYLRFEDGRYVIYGDSLGEDPEPIDVNNLHSLGLLRTVLRGMIDMSSELGIDTDRHTRWQHILKHLSEFPTMERNGKTVFRLSERGLAWREQHGGSRVANVWPDGAIGLDSSPRLLEIARNTLAEHEQGWDVPHTHVCHTYPAAARAGYPPELILAHLRRQCLEYSFPNLHFDYFGGLIENCSGVPATINEMLLQSHEGVLRFFPVWEQERTARFYRLRAYGAFLVSGELRDGRVQFARIESEQGRACCVQNPWPGQAVTLVRDGTPAETLSGERFTFATSVGETIELAPAG